MLNILSAQEEQCSTPVGEIIIIKKDCLTMLINPTLEDGTTPGKSACTAWNTPYGAFLSGRRYMQLDNNYLQRGHLGSPLTARHISIYICFKS